MTNRLVKVYPLDGGPDWILFTMSQEDVKEMVEECWSNPNLRFEIMEGK